jgi:hypothetical protein
MLIDEFGENHGVFIDYLFTMITLSFDVNFENEEVNKILD